MKATPRVTGIERRETERVRGAGACQRMKVLRMLLVGAMLPLVISGAGGAAAKATLDSVAWLAGAWSFERSGRVTTERWTAPAGGVMLGTSHTVAGDKTVEYEFVVIRADANGDLWYVAKPSGQREASFKLVRATPRELLFENPEHDFPQRISYRLKDDGTLVAAIEGKQSGKSRRVEFPYRRVQS